MSICVLVDAGVRDLAGSIREAATCDPGEHVLLSTAELAALASTGSGTGTGVICTGTCTVTHQVEITTPLFNLSLEEGGQIAFAIGAVWLVAWGYREIVRAFFIDERNHESE